MGIVRDIQQICSIEIDLLYKQHDENMKLKEIMYKRENRKKPQSLLITTSGYKNNSPFEEQYMKAARMIERENND